MQCDKSFWNFGITGSARIHPFHILEAFYEESAAVTFSLPTYAAIPIGLSMVSGGVP
jgi:hypothetical protein